MIKDSSINTNNSKEVDVTIEELWEALEYALYYSRKETTYKFAFLIAIIDNLDEVNSNFLSFDVLFSSFTKYYWELVLKYNLKQSKYNSDLRRAAIETILETAAKSNFKTYTPFEEIDDQLIKEICTEVKNKCKGSVVEALCNSTKGLFYTFNLSYEYIVIKSQMYRFISNNKIKIKKAACKEWIKYMEEANGKTDAINLLYKEYDSMENTENINLVEKIDISNNSIQSEIIKKTEEKSPDNIRELFILLNKRNDRRKIYKKIIREFNDTWTKNQAGNSLASEMKYIWGSVVLIPGESLVEDVFSDVFYYNVLKYFKQNYIRSINDIDESILLELMLHPGIGYLKFMNVLYMLFIHQYDDENSSFIITDFCYELNTNSSDEDKFIQEVLVQEELEHNDLVAYNIDSVDAQDDAQTEKQQKGQREEQFEEQFEDLYEEHLEVQQVNKHEQLQEDSAPETNNIAELHKYNELMLDTIEKSKELIKQVEYGQNKYKKEIEDLKSENLELKKDIDELTKNHKLEIDGLKEDIIRLEEEKLDIQVENKELKVSNQSYMIEIEHINRSFNQAISLKEEEIIALKEEVEELQKAREKDKQVLEEFQSMINVLEKIKGFFGRN